MLSTMKLILIVLTLVFAIEFVAAQFPMACSDVNSLSSRTCCPDAGNNRGVCGQDATGRARGRCVAINQSLPAQDRQKHMYVRDHWPYYFRMVCMCDDNYAGYDCNRCKYGYYGENCTIESLEERKSISQFTNDEWTDYKNIISMTRTHNSEYFIFTGEPANAPSTSTVEFENLSKEENVELYKLFVWQHHYVAKDSEKNESYLKVDYAHESTGFPTWHRQYLLWMEWEIQYMLKPTRPNTYHTFRLPYWDWRLEIQRSTDINFSPFTTDRLGLTVTDTDNTPTVTGDLFTSWTTFCWFDDSGMNENMAEPVCNPNDPNGQRQLQRCPRISGQNRCVPGNDDWPTVQDVINALDMSTYDASNFSKYTDKGFRNFLEGFVPLSADKCSADRFCNTRDNLLRKLHNTIHIILGAGDLHEIRDRHLTEYTRGVMANVAASANDPIFLNHHAMIDCIFEEWLKRKDSVQYPVDDSIPVGHRKSDYIVPFFPLYKHEDMFKPAENFGYKCILREHSNRSKAGQNAYQGHAISVLLLMAVVTYII